MANFGAYEMPTPQELLAQLAEQRRKVMTGGNVVQQRSQNIETALDNLFGNPQVRKANADMEAIKRSQNVGPQGEGEDDISYEMRRLSSVRDAMAEVNPEVAAQINTRLLQLGEMKYQRSRLKAQDDRAAAEHDLQMDKLKDEKTERESFGMQTYVYDIGAKSAEAFNLRNPEENSAFLEAARKPNTRVITPAMAWQLLLQDDAQAGALRVAMAKAQSGDGSKVEQQRLENMSGSLLDLYATADRIFQVFDENPDAITGSAAGGAALDRIATELGAAGRLATGAKLKDSDLSIDDWFKANSITSTRMQGLVVGLAYATAKANDPQGRISDKDLAAALQMVGGANPNPAAILSNLNDSLVARTAGMVDRINTANPAIREGLSERVKLLERRREEYKVRMAKFATGERGAGATGVDLDPATATIEELIQDAQSKK